MRYYYFSEIFIVFWFGLDNFYLFFKVICIVVRVFVILYCNYDEVDFFIIIDRKFLKVGIIFFIILIFVIGFGIYWKYSKCLLNKKI